ncbi:MULTISPECIES: MarR family transcriptional regulator [Arthrobacter]|uniref:MarR family transcriptional regulator n=2 Tax=Arthrobacter TaxID=1663 RepID=A0ABU9KIE6_9MICC|nr:MarR family transcriptional regulator [Arthrobacter sp. YJM1]MDP5226157.1 MarR family transcriptional regulator [Arthrobacter sp. YJM1]
MTDAEFAPEDAWSLTDVITRMRRVLRSGIREELPWESLPMAQVELLQRLADEPGLGVSELAERQNLARNTVSNLVQQMVATGLLERKDHETDRRAVILNLTAAGEDRLRAWQDANERRVRHALSALPEGERDAVDRALPALRSLVARMESDDRASKARLRAQGRPDA